MEDNGKILHILTGIETDVREQRKETGEGFSEVHKRINGVQKSQAKIEAKQSAANVILGTIKDVVTNHVADKQVHFTKVDLREDQRKRKRETILFFAGLFIAYGGMAVWFLNLARKAFAK